MPFAPVFGGSNLYPANATLVQLDLTESVVLSWPLEQSVGGDLIVADIIEVNTAIGALSVTFPDARQCSTGYTTLVNNVGAATVTLLNSVGGTLASIASGEAWQLYLTDNATAAGTWEIFQFGAGTSTANAAALAGAGLKAITTTLNQKMAVNSQSAPYAILDGDRAKAVVWTGGVGTMSLPDPATVGADWFVAIRNSGTGGVTVTPVAGTIDGAASKLFSITTSALVISDGTNYFTVGFGQAINSIFDFISINVAGTGDYVLAGAELNRIAYEFTGVLTGNRNIIVPNTVQQYWVTNNTTGAFTLTVKTAAGTGVVVPQTRSSILYCNNVNVVNGETLLVSVPVSIADGGTGATTAAGARTALGATTVGDALFIAINAAAGRTALGASTVGDALFIAANAAAGRTALAATVVGDALFIALTAAAARATLGSTTVGDALFITANAGAARTTLGAGAIGSSLFTAATDAVARAILGSTTVGDALFITVSTTAARATLGSTVVGDALFIAASAAAARGTLGSTTVGDAVFIAASQAAAQSALGVVGGFKVAAGTVSAAGVLQPGSVGVTAAVRNSSGNYDIDITLAGFANPPAPAVTTPTSSGTNVYGFASSATNIHVDTIAAGPVATDAYFSFIAIGT